jgi:tRNA G18 (ribose-2'-O)-methylase SpoU
MQIVRIDDIGAQELSVYRTLRGNSFGSDGSFVADSPRVVSALLQAGIEFRSLLCTQDYFEANRALIEGALVPTIYLGERSELEKITGHSIHHNVMAHAIRPEDTPLEDMPQRVVMLAGLSNMENVGAIARSAAAMGVGGYIVPRKGPHPYGRRAVRVSTGHITRLSVHTYDDIVETLERLRALGYLIVGAETGSFSVPLCKFEIDSERWVLLMGNEEHGIAGKILELCDAVVHIEMQEGIKSLNVAVAASILMYRLGRSC